MPTIAASTEKKPSTDEKPERKPQRVRVDDKFKIFSGTANEALAEEVCQFLGMQRGQAQVTRFADGPGGPGERPEHERGRASDGVVAAD
jgi:ribose-phosphate pyrophosphokinase